MERYYFWEAPQSFPVRQSGRMDGYESMEELKRDLEIPIKINKERGIPCWIMKSEVCESVLPLGFYNKYVVQKSDGTPIDPKARYFVLRYDKDPHARESLRAYAISIYKENPNLSQDLIDEINQYVGSHLPS